MSGLSGFAGPAAIAFLAGLVITGVSVAAEPAHVPRSVAPAPVAHKPVNVQPDVAEVPDDSGIPGVIAWDTRGWPGNRQFFEGVLHREHYDGPIRYAVNPPAGGDHYPRWANCGVYDQPIPPEKVVHSQEHGAVWISYRPDLPHEEVEALEDFVRRQPLVVVTVQGVRRETNERYILLSPFPGQRDPIVLSSWAHQLRLDSPDDPRLQRYIDTFRVSPKYSPEYGPTCRGTPEPIGGRPAFE
jgi:hypothetical protein